MNELKSIVVFCGSNSGNVTLYAEQAYSLGKELAKQEIRLVYGAAKIGIMGQVANGSLDNKGNVVGVIPEFLKLREVYHDGLSQLMITKNMHERKLKMYDLSDGIIMLPGGFGTLEEFFEMLTWAQLGLHAKPIGILNVNGFYDSLMQMLKHMVQSGFVKKENYDMIVVNSSIRELLNEMKHYKPTQVKKWIQKEHL